MCLINLGPAARDWQSLPKDQQTRIAQSWQEFNKIPGVTPGNQLQPPETATTVRAQDGKTLTTDGPFVETKEALDGFFILEADDLDAAIEVAAQDAVAIAEAESPERGLQLLETLPLDDYRYLHSARAEMLRRLGRTADAEAAYRRALTLVHDDAERRLFERRLAELTAS